MEGTPFGRYRLQHLIGRGGMGEVWRAYDTETHRVVAIKLLPEEFASDGEFVARFRREARVAAGLNSPNIVPIHNFGEIAGRLYVDMQLVDGHDLEEVLANGPIRPEHAVRIIEQVAAALRAAHNAGLVHRDVKPSNILLNRDGFAYLIDFGLARTDDDAGLTNTGHTVGTLSYMAPERYDNRSVDLRTDVYSLACVLYQCLTGRRPFSGTGSEQMIAHISTPPPRPTDFANLPHGFDQVIATAMAKDPAARYQTITHFARAARAALPQTRPTDYDFSYPASHPGHPAGPPTAPPNRQQPPPAYPPPGTVFPPSPHYSAPPHALTPQQASSPRRRRKPVVIVAACLVVAAVAIASTVLVVTGDSDEAITGEAAAQNANTTTVGDATYGEQIALPSDGLEDIRGLAAAPSGGLVGICCQGSIFEIDEDTRTPSRRNVPGITAPAIAVDRDGNLYVSGFQIGVQRLNEKLKGTKLPFPPFDSVKAIAVDPTGAVYVHHMPFSRGAAELPASEVWKLDAGASAAVELPFDNPTLGTLAVDSRGVVYAANLFSRSLFQLQPGAQQPTEIRLGEGLLVMAVTVGEDDAVYIASQGDTGTTVYRIPPGGKKPEQLPIKGFTWDALYPALAVNANGDVFVVDDEKNRVLKLPRVKE